MHSKRCAGYDLSAQEGRPASNVLFYLLNRFAFRSRTETWFKLLEDLIIAGMARGVHIEGLSPSF